jgi:hypothetical protein
MAIRLTIRSIPLLALGAWLAACGAPGAASASDCDRVAARDGSDRAAGTQAAPFKTAQKLVDSLGSGQTGCLRAGLYDDQPNNVQAVVRFNHGRVTLRSFPGERAKLKGVIYVPKGSDGVTIADLDIDGRQTIRTQSSVSVGMQIMAVDVTVAGNDITNPAKSCMILGSNGSYGQARNVSIRGNVFHECGSADNGQLDHSIYMENVDGGEITGNIFWGTAAWAVHLYPNARDVRVTRNVMDDNGGGVIVAGEGNLASSGNVIERNIITNSDDRPVRVSWGGIVGSGNVARANCVDSSAGGVRELPGLAAESNVVASPGYLDRAARDYRLAPDSPCRSVVDADPAAEIGTAAALSSPKLAPVARKPVTRRSCKRYKRGSRAARRCARAARRAASRSS